MSMAIPYGVGASWAKALSPEFKKDYFIQLQNWVADERTKGDLGEKQAVFPPHEEVFDWTQYCDIQDVKVVLVGQEPYHATGLAHGLSYSVRKGYKPPPSVKNIFKELLADVPGFAVPPHGDFSKWAEQGVLLLNSVLTVESGKLHSHRNQGWEIFTDAVIAWINTNLRNVVFVAWGDDAQAKCSGVNMDRHLVLTAPHPAPLSAYMGFFNCKHFSQANEYLSKAGKKPIDWTRL